jgi:ribosomal protein S18 acetylase RimI-like enzyme
MRQTRSMVRLRVVTTDDWPLWRELRLAALADAPHAFRARLADWDGGGEEQWAARLRSPGCHHVVALPAGRAAGMVRGVPGDCGVSEVRSLWVSPRARGLGVADALIAAVEEWAVASGASALQLAVLPRNGPAVPLYERHGFAFTGEPGEPLPDRTARELVMAKPLGENTKGRNR